MSRYLREYEIAEHANFEVLCSTIGTATDVVDALFEAYLSLEEAIALPPDVLVGEVRTKARDESLSVHISFGMLLAIRQQLVAGATALLRGHGIESMIFERRAIEFCVFVLRLRGNPELSNKWLDAQNDYNTYWESFSGKKLFRSQDPATKYLEHAYDIASKHIHGS